MIYEKKCIIYNSKKNKNNEYKQGLKYISLLPLSQVSVGKKQSLCDWDSSFSLYINKAQPIPN